MSENDQDMLDEDKEAELLQALAAQAPAEEYVATSGEALPEGAAQPQPITQQGIRSTQTEKYSRYPRHRSYARPGVSSLKGLLT